MSEYKVIAEFPKYEISCDGHIRNVLTKRSKYVLKVKSGYYQTLFREDNKFYTRKVHRLVALAWVKPPSKELVEECKNIYPFIPCVNHIDHNKVNNHYSNLEWCTHTYNTSDANKAGLCPPRKGALNGRAKLTEDKVHEICKAFENGMQPKEAEEVFNISKQQASKIKAGIQWKHVWEQYNIKVNRRKKKT